MFITLYKILKSNFNRLDLKRNEWLTETIPNSNIIIYHFKMLTVPYIILIFDVLLMCISILRKSFQFDIFDQSFKT